MKITNYKLQITPCAEHTRCEANKFKIQNYNLVIGICILFVICVLGFGNFAWAALDPLQIGVGARPLGMGKAYVALAEDGDTVFINPAGLGRLDIPKVTSMYASLFGDVSYVVLGGAYPYKSLPGVLGAGFVSAGVSDIPLYGPGGGSLGAGNYGNSVMFVSYGVDAYKIKENLLFLGDYREYLKGLQVGGSLKYFSQGGSGTGVDEGSGSGIDIDLGLLYTPPQYKFVSGGLNLQNILPKSLGGKIVFKNGIEEGIPSAAKFGLKVDLLGKDSLIENKDQKVIVALDYDTYLLRKAPGAMHFGVEYWPILPGQAKLVALRAGYDEDNLTAGIGIRYRGFEFNYAYHPYSGIAENTTHYFSISYVGPEKIEKNLIVVEPKDKTITRETTIPLSGSVSIAGSIVNAQNKELTLNEKNEFSIVQPLRIGKNLIKISATDPQEKVEVANLRILRLATFSDITPEYWASEPIEYCATTGLVEGYPDQTFKPERALSRAELATLLVRAKGVELPKVKKSPFKDLGKTHWAVRYVAAAQEMGLVKGYPDGTFRPNIKINKAEGILVMVRFEGLTLPQRVTAESYFDIPRNHWAAPEIEAAMKAGFLDYIKGDILGPKKDLARSEAVEILSKTTFAKKKIDELLDFEVGYEEVVLPKIELKTFLDVPEGYWAKKPIEYLATVGIISGFPDGTFKPDRLLSRAELATLLIKARGIELPVVKKRLFVDLPKTHWAVPYIKAAMDLGLVRGYPEGTFKPNKSLTRAEAVTVIARFDELKIPEYVEFGPFRDIATTHWSVTYVTAAKDAGILEYLSGKNFEPTRKITRAEAAEMLSKTTFGKSKIKELRIDEEEKGKPEKKISMDMDTSRIRKKINEANSLEREGNLRSALAEYKKVLAALTTERGIREDDLLLEAAKNFEIQRDFEGAIVEYKRAIKSIIYGELVSKK